MKLRDALLCIDCDEVFTTKGSPCNARCPTCGSRVSAPLFTWVPTSNAYEYPRPKATTLELVHPTPIAA